MSKTRAYIAGAIGGVAMLIGGVPTASAAPGDTLTTFTLSAGTLGIAVQPTASLNDGEAGAVLVTGSLGNVTVTDGRGSISGWTTSAASTTFTTTVGTESTTSLTVIYAAGSVTKTGSVIIPPTVPVLLGSTALPVVSGTVVLGNNTATWNPTLSVTLPPTSLAGLYTGTITTSVA